MAIWVAILDAIAAESESRARIRPTRVQARANLPYARFWNHVEELSERGLVSSAPLAVTPAGDELLRAMRGPLGLLAAQAPREGDGLDSDVARDVV